MLIVQIYFVKIKLKIIKQKVLMNYFGVWL